MKYALSDLSPRERTVLRGILDDKTYVEIAHAMSLSLESIKTYSARMRAKLGVKTKTGLALFAQKHEKDL